MPISHLYHVSPRTNRRKILMEGLRVELSWTSRNEVWLVGLSHLAWALFHIAEKKKTSASDLDIFRVMVDLLPIAKKRTGIYTCGASIEPPRIALQ